MKKSARKFRANNSGQLLIVAALAIAVLVSSTTIYVYELSRETISSDRRPLDDFVLSLEQSTRNLMISSLSNVSNGGPSSVFSANLNSFSQLIASLHEFGTMTLDSALLNDSMYDSGIRLSWGTNGTGVSSAYANFTLQVHGLGEDTAKSFAVNVTTTIIPNGSYVTLANGQKQASLTCRLYSEGKPFLAENMTFFYEDNGNWTQIDASNGLSIIDQGNGVYFVSFVANVLSDTIQVSIHAYDSRDIFVATNIICSEA
jgi:hypothetical protein